MWKVGKVKASVLERRGEHRSQSKTERPGEEGPL